MTLRARLLLGMAVVALTLIGAVLVITRTTERNLVDQVDQELSRTVPQVRGRRQDPANNPQNNQNVAAQPTSLYVALVDPDDETIRTVFLPTTTAQDASPADLTAAEATAALDRGPITVNATNGDLRYRMVVRNGGPNGNQTIVYGLPLENVDEAVQQLTTRALLASVVILAALGLVTFWVLRLGVRPVLRMTDAARSIGEGDLSDRIPEAKPGTEAGDLGVALNNMMGRIEEAFDERTRSEQRLRQFVADASHELRTPVTTIRGYAELYRAGGLSGEEELSEAMRRTEQEATRMGQLVGDLLELARLDEGRPVELVAIDVAWLANDAVRDARAVEPDRPLSYDGPATAPVVADEALLRQIIANLIGNARVHTSPSTPIAVWVSTDTDHTTVTVIDQGPGMAPEVAERAFERFYRADPARARHRGGSGLGLSIVHSAAHATGATVALESTLGVGTRVTISLPHPS